MSNNPHSNPIIIKIENFFVLQLIINKTKQYNKTIINYKYPIKNYVYNHC